MRTGSPGVATTKRQLLASAARLAGGAAAGALAAAAPGCGPRQESRALPTPTKVTYISPV